MKCRVLLDMGKSLTTNPCRQIQMCDWIRNRNETCLDLPSGAYGQRTFLSPAGANSRNCNVKPALSRRQRQKTVQAATLNLSLQFRRRLRDFFAPVWGLPLVAVYVPVHDKIRSEGFAVAANISRRSGGALNPLKASGKTSKRFCTFPVHIFQGLIWFSQPLLILT